MGIDPSPNRLRPISKTIQARVRVERVLASGILDTPPQKEFDDLAALAADLTSSEIALVTILDDKRQWFKASHGTPLKQTPIEWSFCVHAIKTPEQLMIVEDATEDIRVLRSPLVTDDPGIRSYMGVPLCSSDGTPFGTLCVIDLHTRTFSASHQIRLQRLAVLAEHLLNSSIYEVQKLTAKLEKVETEARQQVLMLTHGMDLKAYIGSDGTYEYVNRPLAQRLGLEEGQLMGVLATKALGEWMPPDTLEAQLESALAGHQVHSRELIDYPVGGARWMELSLYPVAGNDHSVDGVVLVARDVHELMLAADTLREKSISQEHFITVLAHDVREPLRTIKTFVDLTLEDSSHLLPEQTLTYLSTAARGAQRLGLLVSGLLEYLKAEGKHITLEQAPLSDVLNDVLDDLQVLIHTTGATIVGELDHTVLCNRVWLRICLQNLIANAIKYARPDLAPFVSLTLTESDGWVDIRVRDNGVGIPESDSDRVFDPFVRLGAVHGVEGTGLGLSLCKKVAVLHGGDLKIEKSDAEGTTFVLRLSR